MLQRQYCLFFLYRHKTPLLCYNVNIVCSSYFVIKRRCYATTSTVFVLSISSPNAVVMLQRQYCLFFLFPHKTPWLCYNVNSVGSSYFVIKRRCHATPSILFVLPYFVIKRRCCATTSILSVLSISS